MNCPNAPMWVTILSALTTPLIAILALYFGARQARTAKNKLRLELFDRRDRVYQAARAAILAPLTTRPQFTDADAAAFKSGIQGARWLFNPVMYDYLHTELWPLLERVRVHSEAIEQSAQDSLGVLMNERVELIAALTAARDGLDDRFEPFLYIRG